MTLQNKAAKLRAKARAICKEQPGYGTPNYRGDPYEAVALYQEADRMADVATTQSSFGGGWIWPLNPEGAQALMEFFGEEPGPIAPLGGQDAYIVEPYQMEDLAEYLKSADIVWRVE